MLSLRRTLKGPLRWRKARGFGIHSPFAFAFVGRVLREKASYYAYPQISALRKAHRHDSPPTRILQLLFRLAVKFDVHKAVVVSDTRESLLNDVLALANPDYTTTGALPAGMVLIDGADTADRRKLIKDAIESETPIVILDTRRKSRKALFAYAKSLMTRGMTFTNDADIAIIVARRSLPLQNFTLRL